MKNATATIKDMKTLANKATAAANTANHHAHVAEKAATDAANKLADTTLYSDKAREAATRSKVHAQNADDHAKRAEINAEDAATYAHTARVCLLLSIIFNAIFLAIFYAIR